MSASLDVQRYVAFAVRAAITIASMATRRAKQKRTVAVGFLVVAGLIAFNTRSVAFTS